MFLSIGGYIGYHRFFKKQANIDAFSAVPADAFFVAQTDNLSKAWSDLSKSQFWAYLKTTEYFAEINEDIETVDAFLKDSKIISEALKSRQLLVAGMVTPAGNWDMAYIIDLQEFSKYYSDISKSFGLISGFSLKKTFCQINQDTKYEIFTLVDKTDNNFQIHISLADNILVVSLDKSVVEKVLKNFNNDYWTNDSNFHLVSGDLVGTDVKFFVNYKQIGKVYSQYSTEKSESLDMIVQSLVYSVLNLELFDDQIELSGNTCLDSVYSYIRAFASVNPGKTKAYNIISNQTALYLSMSFNDFDKFYEALTDEYKRGNQKEWNEMQSAIKIAETYLGISIKDDFLGWIGQEITIAKLRPLTEKSRDVDVAILVNADNIDNAKAHLGNIIRHINKRTPLKIKAQPYRNHEILYLGMKGFFKMFLGKLFSKIEKPYFTYIDDFVIFANSEEVLHQIIDDYLQGRTMIKSTKFENFKNGFDTKSNVMAFIQTPKLYENLLQMATKDEKADIEKNKELINSFARIGFQLSNGKGLFKTKFAIQYDSSATQEDLALQVESLMESSLNIECIDSLNFKVSLNDAQAEDGPFKVLYDSTNVIHYEGNIHDGDAVGIWRTYYESGNLYATANYQSGHLNGIAYFYHDSPSQKILAQANYIGDKLNGEYVEYYLNGNVKVRIEYESNKRNGECIYYYENGNKRYECKYKNGKRSGKATVYNDKGKKIGRLDADNY